MIIYSVPVAIIALLLVLDDSVFSKRHLDLAIGQVQSQQRDGSSPCDVEDQPFGRLGLDVKRKVRPETQEAQREIRPFTVLMRE